MACLLLQRYNFLCVASFRVCELFRESCVQDATCVYMQEPATDDEGEGWALRLLEQSDASSDLRCPFTAVEQGPYPHTFGSHPRNLSQHSTST